MRSVISQTIKLPAAAEDLFEMYLDAAKHEAITGSPVIIGRDPGAEFQAFNGVLTGQILVVVSPSLIVQSWRSTQFRSADPDSTLILSFKPDGNSGQIDLVHLDVPEHDYKGVTEGWENFYWTPWRDFLTDLSK